MQQAFEIAKPVVGAALALLSLYAIVFNWIVLLRGWLRPGRTPSLAPLGGGVAGAAAIFMLPIPNAWFWIPFAIDPGSLMAAALPLALLFKTREMLHIEFLPRDPERHWDEPLRAAGLELELDCGDPELQTGTGPLAPRNYVVSRGEQRVYLFSTHEITVDRPAVGMIIRRIKRNLPLAECVVEALRTVGSQPADNGMDCARDIAEGRRMRRYVSRSNASAAT